MGSRMDQGRSQEGQCWPWETWNYKGEEAVSKQEKPIHGRERGVKHTEQVYRKQVRPLPELAQYAVLLKFGSAGVLAVFSASSDVVDNHDEV